MDLGLPGDDDPRRRHVRDWLDAHPHPNGRALAEAGYVAPHWPSPYGLDAGPLTQLVIDEELRNVGVHRPINPIGIGWAGPTLLYAGTDEQKERWIWPLLSGEEFWCQLFSEPGAGSDLASLTTKAERDGDAYVVNGQKVWTSYAHIARWGIPSSPGRTLTATKHQGISYFVCPMDAPGIEIRPLIDMTGEHAFNEVFFTDVRIPADHLVGPEHGGWELAKVTLCNERVSLSGEGALWGMGPTAADDLVAVIRLPAARPTSATRDPCLVDVFIEAQILRVLRLRMVSAVLAGKAPGAEASVRKAIADAHGQHIMDIARDLAGPSAMLLGTGPVGGWGPEGAALGREHLVAGVLVLPGPHRRGRHGRGATQHRGGKGPRTSARSLTRGRSPSGTGRIRARASCRPKRWHGRRKQHWSGWEVAAESQMIRGGSMRGSVRKVLVSGACALGLAAMAAPVLASTAASPAAAAAAASSAATGLPAPGLYHVPIIGKVVLPGLGSLLGHSLRHATNVQSSNWSGYADTADTYTSVAASWTQPAVNCGSASSGGGGILGGLLGGNGLGNLLGPGGSASSFWVGLDGYASSSVEQLGTDSDCSGGTPVYYSRGGRCSPTRPRSSLRRTPSTRATRSPPGWHPTRRARSSTWPRRTPPPAGRSRPRRPPRMVSLARRLRSWPRRHRPATCCSAARCPCPTSAR